MTLPPLERLTERFLAFTGDFLGGPERNRENVRLKIDHSLRVLDLAREITAREAVNGTARDLAHAAALFHDTGRFPQYARYQSFSDAATENHARLGVRALLAEGSGLLHGFPPRAKGVVLGAVFLHNVRSLDRPLREPLSTVVRVVRDSDKLDILPVVIKYMDNDQPDNKVVTLGVERDPEAYSPDMLAAALERRNADYSAMRWTNDFKLLLVSWVYGLEFPSSARLMRERGHLETILDSLPRTPDLDRLRGQVRSDLDKLCRGIHV